MLKRLAVIAVALAFAGTAAPSAGCTHPYSGKPERLRKPKKKKRPDVAPDDQAATAELDDKCRTNFFDEPYRKRRRTRSARRLTQRADSALVEAEGKEGADRVSSVAKALGTLRSALTQNDPYLPEPTYKMAVAYAMVGKKGCALQLLKRLTDLRKMPEVEREADRTIQRAANDPAFDLFRDEANAALGQ